MLFGCAADPVLPPSAEFGASPQLTEPESSLLPTVNPAKAVGWQTGDTPQPADGLAVTAFAAGLDHPRWLYVLPNGDVLVAESNKPEGSGGFSGVTGWVANQVMAYGGAGGVSADRITLLRDRDGDGVAEFRTTFAESLSSPFGMALIGTQLYIANADSLVVFNYQAGNTTAGPSETRCAVARRAAESPLDQGTTCLSRRTKPVCIGGIKQQHWRERGGGRDPARSDFRSRSGVGCNERICFGS